MDVKNSMTFLQPINAPGYVKVKVVWRNATIRFPEEGEDIQMFDARAAYKSGETENFKGTDGEPLEIPFSTIIPMMGKETLYGWPESDVATPEIIDITSLGGRGVFASFRVRFDNDGLDYEAEGTIGYGDSDGPGDGAGTLNSCNISQINNGPIYLDIGFDLTGRYVKSDVWQQVNVYSAGKSEWNISKGYTPNGYPQAFKRHNFTSSQIEKFKNYEEFSINLARSGAAMKIEFKISEQEDKKAKIEFDGDDW